MAADTVVIQPQTHAKLRELVESEGRGETEILDAAIDAYYRRKLLESMNAGYARLRADPQAWAEELAERALWDQTLTDGVEQDEAH
jgi:hypothetical protein